MTSIVGGLFGAKKPDTSAQDRQIAEQRKQIAEDKKVAEAEKRDEAEKRSARRVAALKGGRRMLLSEKREDAETGIKSDTLGGGTA